MKKSGYIFADLKFLSTFAHANASLAQLVEHDTLNVGVHGSNP